MKTESSAARFVLVHAFKAEEARYEEMGGSSVTSARTAARGIRARIRSQTHLFDNVAASEIFSARRPQHLARLSVSYSRQRPFRYEHYIVGLFVGDFREPASANLEHTSRSNRLSVLRRVFVFASDVQVAASITLKVRFILRNIERTNRGSGGLAFNVCTDRTRGREIIGRDEVCGEGLR